MTRRGGVLASKLLKRKALLEKGVKLLIENSRKKRLKNRGGKGKIARGAESHVIGRQGEGRYWLIMLDAEK